MRRLGASLLLLAMLAVPARGAAWLDEGWKFRLPVDVEWNYDKADGNELTVADFFTGGHVKRDGSDVWVAMEDGRIIPSHVLMVGPGDRVSVVFALSSGVRRYWVYFGNASPPPPPKGTEDVGYKCGLLMETKVWTGGPVNNFQQVEASWERCKEVIGQTMIDRLFLGLNPFDERTQIISRIHGSLFAPVDGKYEFAGSAQQKGALWLDGQRVLFIPAFTGDIRFNAKVDLKRGRHELVFIHVCMGGEPRFSVGWRPPDSGRVEVIGRESFGMLGRAIPGAMEERGKSLTADFGADYVGECFFENHYCYRYHLAAPAAKVTPVKYEWDFGDGQTASGAAVDHVYLADGMYTVTVRAIWGATRDEQSSKMLVRRDRQQITHPPGDSAATQSAVVAGYDLAKLPPRLLPWVVLLHERAGAVDAMLGAARQLATASGDLDWGLAEDALQQAVREASQRGRAADMAAVLDLVPADSRLRPRAVTLESSLLLWQLGDYAKAVQLLEPYAKGPGNPKLKREYGEALVLSQKTDEGKRVLLVLPIEGPSDREAAISGAMARTIEFYITDGDWEAGEDAWDRWQNHYPAEFLEGYGVLLQTKLMEIQKAPEAAARVAEAFARAVPRSSYAPQLLWRAGKLLEKRDPGKSKAILDLLKEKYPEDPLSQDK